MIKTGTMLSLEAKNKEAIKITKEGCLKISYS